MNFKYSTIFSSILKPLVSEEKDRYLALASLIDVGNFIPDIDTTKNVDLLPVAFNACVSNRVNKNGDVIDTPTAIEIYKSFINKPINVEHDRQSVVGVILSAGFSEFGTDAPLTEEQVKDLKGPFNITLGGVLWRIVSPNLTEVVESSNDPTSEQYQAISASWELGFDNYNLVAFSEESDKNIENSTLIDENDKIEELKDSLKIFGGTGKTEDGRYIYRKVIGQVIPLGIGLTTNPAADVKGVAVSKKKEETISSLSENENVISNIIIKKISEFMKIEKIEDITNEVLKTIEASAVTDFIQDQLKTASEQFASEKADKENALKEANEKYIALSMENSKIQEEIAKISKALKELEDAKAAKDSEEKFNNRMSLFDAEYELDDEDREVLASDIKDLDEESFSAYHKKMSKIMKGKKKTVKAPEEVKASEVVAQENVVEKAIENGKEEKATVPVSMAAAELTLLEKYKSAFSFENFEIKN